MKNTQLAALSKNYLTALRAHFGQESAQDLPAARKLGAQAVNLSLETLDLAKIHDHTLATLIPSDSSPSLRKTLTRRAAAFFTEASSSIEQTHSAARKAGASLSQLNTKLIRKTKDLAQSKRNLKEGVSQRRKAEQNLRTSKRAFAKLLKESCHLQKHLQDTAHRILSAQEGERKIMSLTLQDEIAQTLLGINIRLLALNKEVAISSAGFKKEIAITQRLVENSVSTINRFAREFGIRHGK